MEQLSDKKVLLSSLLSAISSTSLFSPILISLPPPPCSFSNQLEKVQGLLQNIPENLTIVPPPPPPEVTLKAAPSLIQEFFPPLLEFEKKQVNTEDVYEKLKKQPFTFYQMTGVTIEEFNDLYATLFLPLNKSRNNEHYRSSKLSPYNKLLLTLIWLKTYKKYYDLEFLFGVDDATISRDLHFVINIILVRLQDEILWPCEETLEKIKGLSDVNPSVVGYLDLTVHESRKPVSQPIETNLFRQDKKCHFQSTVACCNFLGLWWFYESGFSGHSNDINTFRLSSLGSSDLLPEGCFLLGDGSLGADSRFYFNKIKIIT